MEPATPYLDFDPPLERSDDPIEQAALVFHKRNPHVLQEIAKVCLGMKRLGWKQWSINAAFEVVRYNAAVRTDRRVYKLNNSYRAMYARWLMRDFAELKDFFVTRESARVAQDYAHAE